MSSRIKSVNFWAVAGCKSPLASLAWSTPSSRTCTPEGYRLGIFLCNGRLHELGHSHSLIQVIPRKNLTLSAELAFLGFLYLVQLLARWPTSYIRVATKLHYMNLYGHIMKVHSKSSLKHASNVRNQFSNTKPSDFHALGTWVGAFRVFVVTFRIRPK
jgi:hypothetical protein